METYNLGCFTPKFSSLAWEKLFLCLTDYVFMYMFALYLINLFCLIYSIKDELKKRTPNELAKCFQQMKMHCQISDEFNCCLLSALPLWICIFNYQIKQDLQIMKLHILFQKL